MSNIWCWWCCHPFETIPLELPHKYDTHRNKFYTSGTFCSWSCMKSYAIEKHGVTRGSIMCGNIVTMRRKLFDKIGSIKFAPNPDLPKRSPQLVKIKFFKLSLI